MTDPGQIRAYHVTETASVPSILESGLVPAVGPRSADLGEPLPAVWLFPDEDSAETALAGWLGEWYEFESPGGAGTELSLLVLDMPRGLAEVDDFWEWRCVHAIPPECVVEVRDGY